MGEPHVVTLRATRDTDLDTLYRFRPDDTGTPGLVRRTVRADGAIVATVATWREGDAAFVAVGAESPSADVVVRARALRLLVDTLPRPLHARVTAEDAAAVEVLERCGFRRIEGDLLRLD